MAAEISLLRSDAEEWSDARYSYVMKKRPYPQVVSSKVGIRALIPKISVGNFETLEIPEAAPLALAMLPIGICGIVAVRSVRLVRA